MADLLLPKPGDLALTLWQPWADLIMAGVKDVENRSWPVPSTLPQWGRCSGCGVRVWPSRWIDKGVDPERFPFMWEGVQCRRGCGGMFAADGPFPFRLWIHAGKDHGTQISGIADAWIALSEAWGLDVWEGEVGHPPVTFRLAARAIERAVRENRYGALLGSVEVTGCHHADECRTKDVDADSRSYTVAHCSRWAEPDCWHWTLADPQPLGQPVPMRGRQRLWRIPEETSRG